MMWLPGARNSGISQLRIYTIRRVDLELQGRAPPPRYLLSWVGNLPYPTGELNRLFHAPMCDGVVIGLKTGGERVSEEIRAPGSWEKAVEQWKPMIRPVAVCKNPKLRRGTRDDFCAPANFISRARIDISNIPWSHDPGCCRW